MINFAYQPLGYTLPLQEFSTVHEVSNVSMSTSPKQNITKLDKPKVKPSIVKPVQPELKWSTTCIIPGVNKNYYFTLPCQKYKEFVKILGKPSIVDYSKGGYAVWTYNVLKNTKYSFLRKIIIKDQQLYFKYPYEHISFIYVDYIVNIPANKLKNLMTSPIANDFIYDQGTHVLTVRGMNMFYCLSIIKLIVDYSLNKYRYRYLLYNNVFNTITSYNYLQNYMNRQDIMNCLKHIV